MGELASHSWQSNITYISTKLLDVSSSHGRLHKKTLFHFREELTERVGNASFFYMRVSTCPLLKCCVHFSNDVSISVQILQRCQLLQCGRRSVSHDLSMHFLWWFARIGNITVWRSQSSVKPISSPPVVLPSWKVECGLLLYKSNICEIFYVFVQGQML